MHHINTYLFFDLEATGLPEFEFNRTKITEISMIACSKKHILETKRNEIPRVLHKLTLCVSPRKLIQPEATIITGLDNYMLEYERYFDVNAVRLMSHFLQHLQKPICLVAHNGSKFDFPLFRKELEKVTELDDIFLDLFCIDSLDAFKKIDQINRQYETIVSNNHTEANPLESTSAETDVLILFNEDQSSIQATNESTPKSQRRDFSLRKRNSNLNDSDDESAEPPKRTISSRRRLFAEKTETKTDNRNEEAKKPLKYTLLDVYKRIFLTTPKNVHEAEGDTLQLLQCVVAMSEEFIKFSEHNATKFVDIKPLGRK